MSDLKWHWRNCRSLGFSFHFWLWPWAFGLHRDDDVYGGERGLHLGPIGFNVHYSIGNCSSYGLDRFTGLSDLEACDRAAKYEARTALAGVTAPEPDIIEELIIAAYKRGFHWCVENASDPEAAAYVGKAARDYADKTMNAPSAGVTAPSEVDAK